LRSPHSFPPRPSSDLVPGRGGGTARGRGGRGHAAGAGPAAGGVAPGHSLTPRLRIALTRVLAPLGFPAPRTTAMSRPRHFSMLRDFQLADWFTLGNAVCGTGAVFAAMRFLQDGVVRDLLAGMALIPLAFVLDALDGRIARWRKVASTLGRELDSLADVISFGVAPAALGYACGLQGG